MSQNFVKREINSYLASVARTQGTPLLIESVESCDGTRRRRTTVHMGADGVKRRVSGAWKVSSPAHPTTHYVYEIPQATLDEIFERAAAANLPVVAGTPAVATVATQTPKRPVGRPRLTREQAEAARTARAANPNAPRLGRPRRVPVVVEDSEGWQPDETKRSPLCGLPLA